MSVAIKYQIPATGFTIWEFSEFFNSPEAVMLVHGKQLSFQLLGENEVLFMEQQF